MRYGGIQVEHLDQDILVAVKPKNMPTDPKRGMPRPFVSHIHSIPGCRQAYPVHRLDTNTSGLIVSGLSREARADLSAQFASREVTKLYLALVDGYVPLDEQGSIDVPLRKVLEGDEVYVVEDPKNGKPALTHYFSLGGWDGHDDISVLLLRLETGRTHQIRAHLRWLGAPIIGDDAYSQEPRVIDGYGPGQMLHACYLGFRHPGTGQDVNFVSWPEWFAHDPEKNCSLLTFTDYL